MIAAIELAMLERLRVTGPVLGIEWKTRASYPADWDDYLAASANVSFPGAWVVFSGWNGTELSYDGEGRDLLIVKDASFALVVAYENKRPDEQAQRHGGPDPVKEPGSYRLILAALATLAGQKLGLDLASPLTAGPGRHIARTEGDIKRGLSRYSILFTCDFPLVVTGDGAIDPAELLALHVNWDIPLIGSPIPIDNDLVTPGQQLPDDDHADATDHLTLREE